MYGGVIMVNVYDSLIGPYEVSIDITNKCNLRCLHCYNQSGENIYIDDELTDDELLVLVREIVSMKPVNVCFSGGEPLLRKELLYKLISIISENSIMTSMVSNGLLIDSKVAELLKRAGLSRIQISLDGIKSSHDMLRNMQGAFYKVIDCLQILKDINLPTYIGFVPTKWNIDEFNEIVDIALEFGVVSVRTQYFMPTGRGESNKEIIPTAKEYRRLLRDLYSRKYKLIKDKSNLIIEWDDPIQYFFDVCGEKSLYPQLHIKANGNVTNTPYLPITFGNIKSTTFEQIIEEGALNQINNSQFVEICKAITCIEDMVFSNLNLPKNFIEEDIMIQMGREVI